MILLVHILSFSFCSSVVPAGALLSVALSGALSVAVPAGGGGGAGGADVSVASAGAFSVPAGAFSVPAGACACVGAVGVICFS